jgi:hypothetical protein
MGIDFRGAHGFVEEVIGHPEIDIAFRGSLVPIGRSVALIVPIGIGPENTLPLWDNVIENRERNKKLP